MKPFNFLTIYIVLTFFSSFAQVETNIDKWIDQFVYADADSQKAVLGRIIIKLQYSDSVYAKKQIEKLVQITSNYSSRDRMEVAVAARIFLSYYGSPSGKIFQLQKAFNQAEQYNLFDLMAFAKANMSDAYRHAMQYDSAMVCLLQAKTYYEQTNNKDELVAIIHRTGDFYFWANLLDKAEENYKKVMELRGEPIAWKNFRFVVMLNNLGVIENKRGNYPNGEKYFRKSLDYILTYTGGKLNREDSIRLAYTYKQMAVSKFFQKDYKSAQSNYERSFSFTKALNYSENLIDLYILKANFLYERAFYDSAKAFADKAYSLNDEARYAEGSIEIYKIYAYIYEKLDDQKKGSHGLKDMKL